MIHLKKYNESQTGKLYLIEEDNVDSLSFKGMYDDLDKFVEDMKVELISKKDEFYPTDMKLEDLEHKFEDDDYTITINHKQHGSWIFFYTEAELNKIH